MKTVICSIFILLSIIGISQNNQFNKQVSDIETELLNKGYKLNFSQTFYISPESEFSTSFLINPQTKYIIIVMGNGYKKIQCLLNNDTKNMNTKTGKLMIPYYLMIKENKKITVKNNETPTENNYKTTFETRLLIFKYVQP